MISHVVTEMVDHVLELATTWTAWDGTPLAAEDRVYTPHKAIRRVTDHLIDHLAEIEARLAGHSPIPDHWHASASTTPADLAPFTTEDLDEARSRLTRLAQLWAVRLDSLAPQQLDESPGDGWSFREIAHHVAESAFYADSVGRIPRSVQMEVRLPDGLVAYIDEQVAEGSAESRAAFVTRALERERRRLAAERDAPIYATRSGSDLDDLASWTAAQPMDID